MKLLMLVGWFATLLVGISLLILILCYGDAALVMIRKVYVFYFYPTTDVLFIVVAFITYGYIIGKLQKEKKYASRVFNRDDSNMAQKPANTLADNASVICQYNNNITVANQTQIRFNRKQARNSKRHLLLPTLLVATFIIFVILPDSVLFYTNFIKVNSNHALRQYAIFVFYCGYISDALIYVILSTTVGRRLLRSLF